MERTSFCCTVFHHIYAVSSLILFISFLSFAGASHDLEITVNTDKDTSANNGLTCWTCPNKTDNEACNNWAPEKQCASNHTVCKTVHRIHTLKGISIVVNKMCALESDCTTDHVGCHPTEDPLVKDCISCCTKSYCNEYVPSNTSSAIMLSTIDVGNSAPCTSSQSILIIVSITFITYVVTRISFQRT